MAAAMAATTSTHDWEPQARQIVRKRRAESQDNERLSKRLSLLNIEQNGSKLYVPVKTTISKSAAPPPSSSSAAQPCDPDDTNDSMRLDDTKHKVYIYNIDDELSSDNDSDHDASDGKLVFLPDIDKHLRANRIPRHIFDDDEGQLAGMQVVLYRDSPKSLTVPEDKDQVRRAIIESRNRWRERQKGGGSNSNSTDWREEVAATAPTTKGDAGCDQAVDDGDAMDMD